MIDKKGLNKLIKEWKNYSISFSDTELLVNLLITENETLKDGKERYVHFKGNKYTLLHENVLDSEVGPNARGEVVYVGEDGIKWRRPMLEFYGYKDGIKRFERI